MARIPKPWFREDRNSWFVTIRGNRYNLGPDEKEAKRLFHELMAAPETPAPPPKPKTADGLSVAEVFEKYMDWCLKHRSARTAEWTKNHNQSFLDFLKDPRCRSAT